MGKKMNIHLFYCYPMAFILASYLLTIVVLIVCVCIIRLALTVLMLYAYFFSMFDIFGIHFYFVKNDFKIDCLLQLNFASYCFFVLLLQHLSDLLLYMFYWLNLRNHIILYVASTKTQYRNHSPKIIPFR